MQGVPSQPSQPTQPTQPTSRRIVVGAEWTATTAVIASTSTRVSVLEPLEVAARRFRGGTAVELHATVSVVPVDPSRGLTVALDVVPSDGGVLSAQDCTSTTPAGFAPPSVRAVGDTVRFVYRSLGDPRLGADLDVRLTVAHDRRVAPVEPVGPGWTTSSVDSCATRFGRAR